MAHVIATGAEWLANAEADVYSQFGEDGILWSIFERIGETNRWCFEVGAADGEFFSNTKRLRDDGWSAVLIEADADAFARLATYQSDRVRCVHHRIGPDSLDSILAEQGCPSHPDLGVIDIDGDDYAAFEGLKLIRPRVVMVEFDDGTVGTDIEIPRSRVKQATFVQVMRLGRAKGYQPVVATRVNLIFVDEGEWLRS